MFKYLEKNILLLKYAGLWVTGNYFEKKAYNIYSIIVSTLFVFLDTFCLLLNMQNIADNLERSSSFLTILSIKMMGFTKLTMFITNRNIVFSIMASLKIDQFRCKNDAEKKIISKSLNSYKISFEGFFMVGFLSYILYVLLPLIMKQEKMLPFDSWYPYDSKKPCWYVLTYSHQVLSTAYITMSNVGIDTFSSGLMAILSCQCEILEHYIMSLDETIYDCDIFFKNVIEHHKQILKWVSVIFLQFYFSEK